MCTVAADTRISNPTCYTPSTPEAAELTLPPTLRLTILRRLSFLSEDTLQELRIASILGSGFSLADLATVTGRPAVDLTLALTEAVRARVLEDDGTLLRFRHDLIRESIYADLPASVRRGLHREAGQRLAQAGAPSLQVAEHLARGAGQGDTYAIGWLTRAAREGGTRSPDVAADLLERATALEYPAIGADLVRLSLAAGDIERARDVSAAVAEMASGNEVPWMTGAALRCRGLVEDNAEILQSAAAAYARGSRPLGLALTCEDAGAAFARHGQVDRGRPLLDQAIGIYERLDAARDLARAEAVLREAGIRRGRRGKRARPKFGWDSLTPAERAVAGLVAEGLSNPQIGQRLYISSRTVQTHLAHVFAKLDISARAQLAVEVSRHQRIKPADAAGSAGE